MSQRSDAPQATVLVVDDEPSVCRTLGRILQTRYDVVTAPSGEAALDLVSERQVDLALLDINLPRMDGLELLESLKDQLPHLAVVMLTGHGTVDSAVHAMRHGAGNYLQKPASPEEILDSVQDALDEAQQRRGRATAVRKAQRLFEAGLQQLGRATPGQKPVPANGKGKEQSVEQVLDPERFVQKGPLIVDTYRRSATLHDEPLELTPGEYDLLLCLAENAPEVLDPQELVRQTRGFECTLHEARDLIRWQVYLLRQKVEADPSSPQYILNVRGRGYMWAVV